MKSLTQFINESKDDERADMTFAELCDRIAVMLGDVKDGKPVIDDKFFSDFYDCEILHAQRRFWKDQLVELYNDRKDETVHVHMIKNWDNWLLAFRFANDDLSIMNDFYIYIEKNILK